MLIKKYLKTSNSKFPLNGMKYKTHSQPVEKIVVMVRVIRVIDTRYKVSKVGPEK